MSLKGSIKGETLQGNINRLHELRGYSAYEVAVLEGFEGTKEEWLASLKGNKGDKGDRGNPGVYVGSGDMPEDCNVQIDPNGDALSEEDIVGAINEQIANIESEVGNAEATYLYPTATVTNDAYVDNAGEIVPQDNCKTYSYSFGGNGYPEGTEGRKLYIKTYMYGNMAIYNSISGDVVTNENADIENNPESGIFEYEVDLDVFCPWGETLSLNVSFCENPYMDKPEVRVKSTLWQEIQDIRNDAVTYEYLTEFNFATYDDAYVVAEEVAAAIVDEKLADTTVSVDKVSDLDYYLAKKIPGYIRPYFQNGVSCDNVGGAIDTYYNIRYFKEVTLTDAKTIFLAFPDIVRRVDYVSAQCFDTTYNTRVIGYELVENMEIAEGVWDYSGVRLILDSELGEGEAAQVTVSAHIYAGMG